MGRAHYLKASCLYTLSECRGLGSQEVCHALHYGRVMSAGGIAHFVLGKKEVA